MHTLARRFAILAAVLPLAGATPSALAQDAAHDAAPERQVAATLFSLDFGGGSLGQLVSAIRSASTTATVVVSADAEAFRVPPLTLRQVDLKSVGWLVERVASAPTNEARALSVSAIPISGTEESALSFSLVDRRGSNVPQTRTWSVREHLNGGLPADDLLSAVQAMVETEPGDSTLRFHEPTALLIIRGSEAQLDLVTDGLDQLRAEVRQDQNRTDSVYDDMAVIEDRLVEARGELRIAEKQVEVARASLKQMQDAFEEGIAPEVGVTEAELEVVRADAEFEVVARRVQRYTEALNRLRERLDD
ncbi:MAG: TolC family protein [Phycisphaerales bacterium]